MSVLGIQLSDSNGNFLRMQRSPQYSNINGQARNAIDFGKALRFHMSPSSLYFGRGNIEARPSKIHSHGVVTIDFLKARLAP